jgi:hypothetical protein
MSDGIGCTCCARSESECCCDVDWTPQEVYELRQRVAELESKRNLYNHGFRDGLKGLDMLKETLSACEKERDDLRQICRDAYEVYAGSEGIPTPETAAEAYVGYLLNSMKDEIARGLK